MKKLWIGFIQTAKKIKKDPKNVWWYIQGTIRMFLYKNARFLVRQHIVEQFEYRRKKAIVCSERGSCKFCNCKTDDLFFSDKACSLSELTLRNRKLIYNQEDPCYGIMMSEKEWDRFKATITISKVQKIVKKKIKKNKEK